MDKLLNKHVFLSFAGSTADKRQIHYASVTLDIPDAIDTPESMEWITQRVRDKYKAATGIYLEFITILCIWRYEQT